MTRDDAGHGDEPRVSSASLTQTPSEVDYDPTLLCFDSQNTVSPASSIITAPGFHTIHAKPLHQHDTTSSCKHPTTKSHAPCGLDVEGDKWVNSQVLSIVSVLLAFPSPVINTFTATTQVVGPGGTIDLSWGTS